jgi:hypothetical protein
MVIEAVGFDAALVRLQKVTPAIRKETRERVEEATDITSDIIRSKMYGRRGSIPNHVLGIRTNALWSSIGDPNHKWGIRRVKPLPDGWETKAGTSAPYAWIHEEGGTATVFGKFQKTMPQRPFFTPGIKTARPIVEKIMGQRFVFLKRKR